METILTLGIPLNVGSAYTLSSQALLTLLGSPDTLLSRFFFFFLLYFTTLKSTGVSYLLSPAVIYTMLAANTILSMHVLEYWYSPLATH